MNGYDLVDEAVVDAPCDAVWEALLAEFRGAARWWVPSNTFAPASGSPDRVGGEVRVTVHTKGVEGGGPKLRFTARTTGVEPGRRLDVEYVDGVFRGPSSFRLDPVGDGSRTRIGMRFQGRPHGWLKALAKVTDVGLEHSKVTSAAFVALGDLLAQDRPAGSAAAAGAGGRS
ncbi:SRPBCC family protein [Streptomyces cacaoi]